MRLYSWMNVCVYAFVWTLPTASHAKDNLDIRSLLAEDKSWKFDLSYSFLTSSSKGSEHGDPTILQVGPSSFISIPTFYGEYTDNTNTSVFSLGLRYGLSKASEIRLKTNYVWSNYRHVSPTGTDEVSDSRLNSLWIGINHKVKEEDDIPALLINAEVAAYESILATDQHGKSFSFGMAMYKTSDPLVFSLSFTHQIGLRSKTDQGKYRPGNLSTGTATVYFSANETSTLSTSARLSYKGASSLNGIKKNESHTSIDLIFGIGISMNKKTTTFISTRINATDKKEAEINLTLSRNI